ncbi:hypothetical protein ABPG72_001524 [Tetrahymena utriculariae]
MIQNSLKFTFQTLPDLHKKYHIDVSILKTEKLSKQIGKTFDGQGEEQKKDRSRFLDQIIQSNKLWVTVSSDEINQKEIEKWKFSNCKISRLSPLLLGVVMHFSDYQKYQYCQPNKILDYLLRSLNSEFLDI